VFSNAQKMIMRAILGTCFQLHSVAILQVSDQRNMVSHAFEILTVDSPS
jgi:hypothetical protein